MVYICLGTKFHSCPQLYQYNLSQCKDCGRIELDTTSEDYKKVATTSKSNFCLKTNNNEKPLMCKTCFFDFKVMLEIIISFFKKNLKLCLYDFRIRIARMLMKKR